MNQRCQMPDCFRPAAWTVTLTFCSPEEAYCYCEECKATYPPYIQSLSFWPIPEFAEFTDDVDFFDAHDLIDNEVKT